MPAESKVVSSIGLVLAGILTWIAVLSQRFALDGVVKERPIILVFALFTVAFGLYLFALRTATRSVVSIGQILAFSVAFRAVLLFSTPILEIDVYRYIWDGNATVAGVNPYEFSPKEVLDAEHKVDPPANLRRLSELSHSTPALRQILGTIHFGKLPSPYPPVSQVVFAVSAAVTPDGATVRTHLFVMRLLIVLFDLGTLLVLILILKQLGKPIGWAIAYGWCPLVLKEFANSGHLDSITVFFTVVAAYAILRGGYLGIVLSAILLAAATAGKFYPVVLVPVFAVAWTRMKSADEQQSTAWIQCIRGILGAAVYLFTTVILLLPMFVDVTPPEQYVTGDQNSDGVHAFVRYWEMNDFLFMLTVENLKPDEFVKTSHPPWFVVVSNATRNRIVALGERAGLPPGEVPFLTARALTVLVFGLLVLWSCWQLWVSPSAANFLRSCFSSVAWVWLLAPTLNPWYWTWSLAFIPFAVRREWLWISGLAMIYYLRFWFEYHYTGKEVFGTPYQGVTFFDYIVSCIEFGPWFLMFWAAPLFDFLRKKASGRSGASLS